MLEAPRRERAVTFDLIIPMYNEEAVVDALFGRLEKVFAPAVLEQHGISRLRYVLVDDGSTDRTAELVARRIADGVPAILCRLSRNFGHQAAVVAGLDHSDADVTGIIDADLQDPPEELLAMAAAWRRGSDVVFAVRANRKEAWPKRLAYFVFYRGLHYLSEGRIPKDSGDFCLMDRRVVEALRRLPERLRFVRGLRAWVGFRQSAHVYDRQERALGRPKYTLAKLYQLATDGIASSSIRPLRMAQMLSIVFFFVAAGASFASIVQVLRSSPSTPDTTLLYMLMALTSVMAFSVLLCLYILSAYIGRMYLEVKGRPSYVLMEVLEPPGPKAP
jgi:dolichol-phosphate mannosyltransferase